MEDLLWLALLLVGVSIALTLGLGFLTLAAPVVGSCVFGAATHGFCATMWRGVVHRGGVSAAQGPDEPAFRAYYRSQVWHDLRTAVAAGWRAARAETERIRDLVPAGDEAYLVALRVAVVVCAYVGFAGGALLAAIVGLVPVLCIALTAAGAWASSAPLRAAERLRRQHRGTYFDCPECRDRFPLPVYACPVCGARHRRLAPGPFGVLRHRCTCGARLPAVQPLGRARLAAECPEHGHALGESVGTVPTFHVAVAGGSSAGKSTFLAAALLGLEQAAVANTLATTVQSSSRDGYDRLLDGFRKGVIPAKTKTSRPPALVAEVRGRDAAALLYAYDLAGEAYGDEFELGRDPAHRLTEGVVLLVDPFALERVRGEHRAALDRDTRLRPSAEPPQRVLERLVGVLAEQGVDMRRVPAAICVTKVDALGIGDVIDAATGPDEDRRVRAWLEAQGAGNLLRSAAGTFAAVRCFKTSALGRTAGDGAGPFTPSGTLEPLLWLLAGAGVHPAAAGDAEMTQTHRFAEAGPLDVGPRRPIFTSAIDAVTPWPLAANGVVGFAVLLALSVASSPLTTLASTASVDSTTPAPTTQTAPPPPAVTAASTTPAPSAPRPAPHRVARGGPGDVLRRHYNRLASGNYEGAFALMSRRYRRTNRRWIAGRRAARPSIHVVEVGQSGFASGFAFVPITFYARDHHAVPGSDTKCRRFRGRARLVKERSHWRYDPTDQLDPTVLPRSLDVCKSLT